MSSRISLGEGTAKKKHGETPMEYLIPGLMIAIVVGGGLVAVRLSKKA